MDLVENQIISSNKLSKREGDRILSENEFFQDLVALMENDQFKKFFKKHLSNWTEVKSTIIYMKLYDEFKTKYKKLTNDDLEESIVVYLLCKLMRDRNLRPVSIKTIDKMYEKGRGNYFKELEKYIKNKETQLLLE
ncbi:MAG: hypothetical protein CMG00_07630 [Candidatus Marinimicrobia bacterium]|nr:hypothetical protein [Candidatus Neomarinimicrobiota bacterium]|tara:strand:- start:530 stop:937 length:408 start_codon:yes stop_codon:yes gene_type:complete